MTDGGNLRSQLESALARIKEQDQKIRQYEVREVIGRSDFNLVTEADLAQADGDLEEAAAAIQKQKLDQQKQLLESAGLPPEQVEQVLAGQKLESPSSGNELGAALGGLQSTGGQPPPKVSDRRLHGRAAVRAHFAEDD